MIIANILTEIQDHIKEKEGELIYENWCVVFSFKEQRQFLYDTQYYKKHVKSLGQLDIDFYEDLNKVIEAAGLGIKEEDSPKYIYVCKLSTE
jgi:hypothetical protein